MSGLSLGALDIIVLVVLLLAALIGFARGFVHDVLAMAGWVGAIYIAFHGFPLARPYVKEIIPIGWAADAAAAIAIFLVTLLLLSIITKAVAGSIRESAFNNLDRALGFLFGAFKGALFICLIYMGAEWLFLKEDKPQWLTNAHATPYIEKGVEVIKRYLPNQELEKVEKTSKDTAKKVEEVIEAKKALDKLMRPPASDPPKNDTTNYPKHDKDNLNRLIQQNSQ